MKKNKHFIEKVFLEIDTNSMKVANSLKNNINMFIENELSALIEQELNRFLLDENQILQIEKLDISIDNTTSLNGSINTNELKEKIKNQLAQKLESAKNNSVTPIINTSRSDQILSQTEKKSNTLIYYLTNGVMPWWISKNDDAFFNDQNLNLFINSETFKHQFQSILVENSVQKRLINQFSNKQLASIISVLSASSVSLDQNKIINILHHENSFQLKELFWISIFKFIKNKNTATISDFYFKNIEKFQIWNLSFEEFVISVKQFIPFNPDQSDIVKAHNQSSIPTREEEYFHIKKPDTDNPDSQKGYYVQNAGLIILHPFIKELFKNCNLIKEGNTIIDKELAAHILHYAATKKEQDYEHLMLFEKFLCGIPIQQSITREINIDDSHKKQVEEMLQSVLQHWNALKSTSTDLLRNEFLQREGKLDIQENNPRLFIEKKTQDILLEKIPWNISVTKIPWIEKLIYTDW
nr:contractile injection system tape measure protein [uncultured Flavobacterium sp.]